MQTHQQRGVNVQGCHFEAGALLSVLVAEVWRGAGVYPADGADHGLAAGAEVTLFPSISLTLAMTAEVSAGEARAPGVYPCGGDHDFAPPLPACVWACAMIVAASSTLCRSIGSSPRLPWLAGELYEASNEAATVCMLCPPPIIASTRFIMSAVSSVIPMLTNSVRLSAERAPAAGLGAEERPPTPDLGAKASLQPMLRAYTPAA